MNKQILTRCIICVFIFLIVFSFINNLINTFNILKNINDNTPVEVFYEMIDNNINIDKQNKIKLIFKYIIYFIFFEDFEQIARYV